MQSAAAPPRTGIEVVQHLGVRDGLDLATSPHGHLNAVACFVVLLAAHFQLPRSCLLAMDF